MLSACLYMDPLSPCGLTPALVPERYSTPLLPFTPALQRAAGRAIHEGGIQIDTTRREIALLLGFNTVEDELCRLFSHGLGGLVD